MKQVKIMSARLDKDKNGWAIIKLRVILFLTEGLKSLTNQSYPINIRAERVTINGVATPSFVAIGLPDNCTDEDVKAYFNGATVNADVVSRSAHSGDFMPKAVKIDGKDIQVLNRTLVVLEGQNADTVFAQNGFPRPSVPAEAIAKAAEIAASGVNKVAVAAVPAANLNAVTA